MAPLGQVTVLSTILTGLSSKQVAPSEMVADGLAAVGEPIADGFGMGGFQAHVPEQQ
jgi:hypothetical protein